MDYLDWADRLLTLGLATVVVGVFIILASAIFYMIGTL